jgi:uncharacterized repeat protein (TIGR02543 family)
MQKLNKAVSIVLFMLMLCSAFIVGDLPVGASDFSSVIEYRYKTKLTTTSYSTSLSGYTQNGYQLTDKTTSTVSYVSSWPSGFNTSNSLYTKYHQSPVSASETSSKKVTVDSTSVSGYIYWHWCRGTYTSGPINRYINFSKTSEFSSFHAFETTSAIGFNSSTKAYQSSQSGVCKDTYWWFGLNKDASGQLQINKETYSTYNKLYSYYKWSDWSDWSNTPVTEDDNTVVETRTTYIPTGTISSTNYLSSNQIVTLTLDDDMGVAGYYWGTSSNYSDNTYTSTSDNAVTKTVSNAGTYYLTVKDITGNLSITNSITFYNTVLDTNGGNESDTLILTKKGDSFVPTTPTRSGYEFKGWSTSNTATTGSTTISPSSNKTYYAVWANKLKKQTITAKSFSKYYGDKSFNLNAKTNGDGKLSYSSSNKKIVTVSSKGKVSIKGCGKVTITIKAAETSNYKTATKKITVTVSVKPVDSNSFKIKKLDKSKTKIKLSWGKVKKATAYKYFMYRGSKHEKIKISQNNYFIFTFGRSIKKSDKGKTINVKVRTVVKINGKIYYSAWTNKSLTMI